MLKNTIVGKRTLLVLGFFICSMGVGQGSALVNNAWGQSIPTQSTSKQSTGTADIQTPEGRQAERARIVKEKAEIEVKYSALDNECKTRFIVTSCRDDVRQQRNQVMGELRRQEKMLDGIERKQAAAERIERLDDRRR